MSLPAVASAQPMGEVVVVPFGASELTDTLNLTTMLEAELANERVSLIPLHDARDRFTARSRPPQTASDSDLDVLAREAREAIEHVAFGRTAAAQKSVREVITRAERTLESLNRETATARHILDACLSLVRTTLQADKRDLALEQATRCRRLVPDLVPNETAHPANVVGVLAEADNLLRRMRIGHLVVRSAPESNCSVYLNGRHLGTTPFQLERAAAGDYRVQVECGRTLARVHVVQLGDHAVSLLVDTQLDRAVASDPRLLLRYEKRDEARARVVSHAIQLGREVQADDVVLVALDNDRAELLRVQVAQQRLVARASVPWTSRHGFSRPALERALVALAEARLEGVPSVVESGPVEHVTRPSTQGIESIPNSMPRVHPSTAPPDDPARSAVLQTHDAAAPDDDDVASASAQDTQADPEIERPAPTTASASPSRKRRMRRAGFTLLGASAAIFAVGLGYDLRTQALQDELATLGSLNATNAESGSVRQDPLPPDGPPGQQGRQDELQTKFERAQDLRWVGLGAGALGVAATVLLVAPRQGLPWWSYTLATVGLGLVAIGSYEIADVGRCQLADSSDTCRRPRDSAARGAMLISAAVPLLSVPLVQLLKRERGRTVALSSQPSQTGLRLVLRATY